MKQHVKMLTTLAVVFGLFITDRQPAQSQDFYEGKTLKFLVGSSPGGSLDTYTRLIGRHMGRFMPGNPSVIVQNMPGAGSLVAANYTYNRAEPDGLTIGAFAAALVLQQVMGNKGVKFDGKKLGWIGSPGIYHSVCVIRKESGVATVEEWFAAKRPLHFSGMGPGAGPSDIPRVLNAAIGLPLKLVEGYRGGSKVRHAVEVGEVDGYCGGWQGVKRVWDEPIRTGKYVVIIQASPESHPDLTHVPLADKYAKTAEAKRLLDVNETIHGVEFVYSTAPGVPKERLQLLRTAFLQALQSSELLAEAKKAGLEVAAGDGDTLAKKLGALYDLPASTVSRLKEVLLVPKKR